MKRRRIAAVICTIIFLLSLGLEWTDIVISSYFKIFIRTISSYVIIMEVTEWFKGERFAKLVIEIGKHSYAFFLLHHVFLFWYISHFAGVMFSGSNTLVLFLSSIMYIYLLALGLDKLYAYLGRVWKTWFGRQSKQ